MKRILYTILAFATLLSVTACNDWLDVSPETEKKKEEMLSKESGYKNVLTGAYIRLKSTSLYGEQLSYGIVEMLAQHWNNTSSGSLANYLKKYDYRASAVESAFSSLYGNLYKVIADVNGLLEEIDANKEVFSDNNYELVKGEALALRAFCHFDVLRLYGPMPTNLPSDAILPYVTKVSIVPNSKVTYQEFTKQLLADLSEAESLMKDRDPICFNSIAKLNGTASSDDTFWNYRQLRMNYYAVCALKARVHLWVGDKDEALKYANLIIDAKDDTGKAMYRLGNSDDCASGDLTLSCEHIFNINVQDLAATSIGKGRGDIYQKTQSTLRKNYYSTGTTDIRYTLMWENVYDSYWWTYNNYFQKYMQSNGMPSLAQNTIPLIRLYEMYLIAMECSDLATANDLYKVMCVARDIPSVEIADAAQLQNLLVMEYNREFYGEGQAFYAYKRLGIETIIDSNEPGSAATYVVPLPKAENI